MTSPFGDTGNTRLFLVWVTAFWSHHRQVTSKSYVGPYYLGNTLQRPAHSTAISSVLILQWGPCCLMLPDGYMKDKFPKPKKFLGIVQFPFPTHSPHPPPFCQIWIKTVKKKKSQVFKTISFQEIWTQLTSFPNEPQFEKILTRAEEQNWWWVFKQEVCNIITQGCNLSGYYMLSAEDWFKENGFLESPEA